MLTASLVDGERARLSMATRRRFRRWYSGGFFLIHTRNIDLRPTHKENNLKIMVFPLLQKPKRTTLHEQ